MSDRSFAISVPAEARYLKAIRAFFQSALGEACGEATEMLVLALDESCSNILKHRRGCPGPIRVEADLLPDRVRFRVAGYCSTDDIPRIKPRDLKEVRPGGLGTHYIASIMDRVDFEPDPGAAGRMVLVLEKSLPGTGDSTTRGGDGGGVKEP